MANIIASFLFLLFIHFKIISNILNNLHIYIYIYLSIKINIFHYLFKMSQNSILEKRKMSNGLKNMIENIQSASIFQDLEVYGKLSKSCSLTKKE